MSPCFSFYHLGTRLSLTPGTGRCETASLPELLEAAVLGANTLQCSLSPTPPILCLSLAHSKTDPIFALSYFLIVAWNFL